MKNILKVLSVLLIAVSLTGCDKDPDNVVYEVLEFETGAILRTLSVDNALLNSSDPSTAFVVTVEEQDEQDGGLLESVDIYVSLRDLTPENGTAVSDDKLVTSFDASAFSTSPVGLPMATLSATYGEAFAALGLPASDISPGDIFTMELRLNLTDGRTFGSDSAGSSVTGGFFSSPFAYNALIICSPEPGDYRVDMFDSFGDGWQTDTGSGGSGIKVDIDGTIVTVGMCSPYGGSNIGTDMDPANGVCTGPASLSFYEATATVTVGVGTESATWSFPGDQYGEIAFDIYAPDDSLVLSVGTGEGVAGLLPVTVCATN